MAERATFTVDQVINEIDELGDESDDGFDGYLDTESDDVTDNRNERNEEADDQDVDVGAHVEIGPSGTDAPEYSLSPGCSAPVEGNSPLPFFSLLITNSMLQSIVDQTNLYAEQFISSHNLGPHSRARSWAKHVFDVAEMLQFLAIVIVMEIVRYPQIESHWSTLWPYSNTQFSSVSLYHVFVGKRLCSVHTLQVMKRDRFTLILRFLHLNDSRHYKKRGEPGYDPLYKLRPFIDPLFDNFQAHYVLYQELSIDETMIGFNGRIYFIQYMPNKPTKWGMKAYVLADSHTGYMYNWYLYTGMFTHKICHLPFAYTFYTGVYKHCVIFNK